MQSEASPEAKPREMIIRDKDHYRKLRREERMAKEQAKSEAKRARKANIQPNAKWTEERRAQIKLKTIANRPAKQERKRLRLLSRSEKLKIQADKLLAESKRAMAKYEAMTKAKEAQERAEQGQRENVTTEANHEEEEHDVASSESSSQSSRSSSASDSPKSDGGAPLSEPANSVPADALALKKRRNSGASSAARFLSVSEDPVEFRTFQKELQTTPNDDAGADEREKRKKKKKSKFDLERGGAEVIEERAGKDKKRKRTTEDDGDKEEATRQKEKKENKERKGRRQKKEAKGKEKVKHAADTNDDAPANEEAWNIKKLSGGAARQAKFGRLLGGKKGSSTAMSGSSTTSPHDHLDATKAEAEIQRQFEAGMRMKHDGGGKRRGLGA